METVNILLLVIGVIIILFGVLAFFNSNFARLINIPFIGPSLKSFLAIIIGLIMIIISFIVKIPTNLKS